MRAAEKGFALVLVLVVTALITAMVIEFSYGVYVSLSGLHNWRTAQRLSAIARSGIVLAQKTIVENPEILHRYAVTDSMELPVEHIVQGFEGIALIRVDDENARFNVNSLRFPNGTINTAAHAQLKDLLSALNLRQELADTIARHIVKDSGLPGTPDPSAKNGYLDSVDELLTIKGIDRRSLDALFPYVTVHGVDINGRYDRGSWLVNVNTATAPVIMSTGVARDLAERIVRDRQVNPYPSRDKVPIDDPSAKARITVTSAAYRIVSTAEERGLARAIECVADVGQFEVKYWRER